jgi:phosphotransferase system enzyme I (PtsI)
MNHKNVLAILTEAGGATSHSAILARSYEIPAVLSIRNLMNAVAANQIVAVDGCTGEINVAPDAETISSYTQKRARFLH